MRLTGRPQGGGGQGAPKEGAETRPARANLQAWSWVGTRQSEPAAKCAQDCSSGSGDLRHNL